MDFESVKNRPTQGFQQRFSESARFGEWFFTWPEFTSQVHINEHTERGQAFGQRTLSMLKQGVGASPDSH